MGITVAYAYYRNLECEFFLVDTLWFMKSCEIIFGPQHNAENIFHFNEPYAGRL